MTAAPAQALDAAPRIHPGAVVEKGARLGAGVRIGPFCHVGGDVQLGDGVELVSHVVVAGRTEVGAGVRIFPFASIGHAPQDLKFRGEPSRLVIGARCLIREGVTMNPGTEGGGMVTEIGENSVFLANSHVAHDCRIGANVILSNNVMLAGHVTIGDHTIMGGGSAVHQFVRIGAHAFVGGLTGIGNDMIPWGLASGSRADLVGLNLVGMKRAGLAKTDIHDVRRAYRLIFGGDGLLKDRVEEAARQFPAQPQVQDIVAFLRAGGDRSVLIPAKGRDLDG